MKKAYLIISLILLSLSAFADGTLPVNPAGVGIQSAPPAVHSWVRNVQSSIVLSSQTAMSSKNYLVTAGDVYSLGMLVESELINYNLVIDNSYKIKVLNLAILDAAGKTYNELKSMVDSVMQKNYPMSGTVFFLSNPGSFRVMVKGEVTQTSEVNAWGLSRLSQTIPSVLTDYSSIRDVEVTSLDGKTKTYDLFKALRFGDLSQDPLLRPGDVITLKRAVKTVTLTGAVERPGTYQLVDGEGLGDLVNVYGSGLIPLADTKRVELVRYLEGGSPSGEKALLTATDIKANYGLKDYDIVTVGKTSDLQPVMLIEGAVGVTAGASTQVSQRVSIKFNPGENYANLVRNNRGLFSAISDTANAYILRGEEIIALNLNPMMYDVAFMSDKTVQNNDLLVVPFRQYFITVSGAVLSPGRYPYIPDRTWEYYIGLAGGIVKEANMANTVKITDIKGNRMKKGEPILPETTIEAYKNSVLYYFNLYSPVITTTFTIITGYYAVKGLLAQ